MTLIIDLRAFKRAAQAISKLPGAAPLSVCQTSLARAVGYRDFHHAQAVLGRTPGASQPGSIPDAIDLQVEVISNLSNETALHHGDLLHALATERFFPGAPTPEVALAVREKLFSREYPTSGRSALAAPCRIKEARFAKDRGLLLTRGPGSDDHAEVMTDHSIVQCVSHEIQMHRTGSFFIPLRFWVPYGAWTEEDGATVLFSREYCPLWRIEAGGAPIRDDPDRWVPFTDQRWFFDEGSFRGQTDKVISRALGILREHRVISMPRLVEWLPECLETRQTVDDRKRWPHLEPLLRKG
jgi:hypothetical protein